MGKVLRDDHSYSPALQRKGFFLCVPVPWCSLPDTLGWMLSFYHLLTIYYACVHVCVCACVRVCPWKPKYNLGCYSPCTIHIISCCLRQRLPVAWNLSCRLGWMVSQPQRSSLLYLPSAGITSLREQACSCFGLLIMNFSPWAC